MSGMEPLAVLGLVCNILQLIEVGSQTYELIQVVYKTGSIDDSLNQKAVILGNISEDIKPVNRPAKKHERQLVETAESCAKAARQLREEIIHLVGNAKKGRLSSAVKAVLMTWWRKPRLERLKNELDEAEKLMHTGLLVHVMSTVNDTELNLADLAADVRSLVQEYRKGHRDTKRLVSRECLDTRTHVSTAIQGTNEAIERVGQDLGKLAFNVDVQVDQVKRERLLQSLKYPGFNERRNEVREAHTDTFQWVFAGDGGKPAEPYSSMSAVKWDSFSNWLKSTDTIYWICGKPGSGKSTLVKYILADAQIQTTQQCLDVWSPGCLITSHYFWRPGNPMQRSIKGLFCSLLCQLLENSEIALARVLESVTGSSMKGDVTDWSLEELQSTLLSTMETHDRPICMFLDGLDEVYPDQPTTLLDKIKKLSVAGKTKMCLASRPEPPLQRRLYNMPQLRLQDLTVADLTQYGYANIEESKFSDRGAYESFVRSLAQRAEGVFLWLVLVTKSVRNGFENGDSIGIIHERIDRLKDGDLESLYKDMWDRASKDNPDTYRRTAALYFRIMLLYNRGDNEHLRVHGKNLSVFTMMFATTELAERTLNATPQPLTLVPEETLLQGCKEVERIAEIYCFGLLEVSQRDGDEIIEDMIGWYRGKYDKLLVYAQVRKALLFTHRTALDFLVDTAQGKEILSFDDTAESSHAFRLVAANLAHAELFCSFSDKGRIGRRSSLAWTHLQSIDSVRKAYIDTDESVTADYTRMMMHYKRLCDFEKVFAGARSAEAFACSGVNFFKTVAMYNWRCLDIFEDQIKALDKETLSEILHILCDPFEISCVGNPDGIFDQDILRFISLLLTEGADPNWDGTTSFVNIQFVGSAKPYIFPQTSFAAFLSRTLKQAQRDKYQAGCRSGKELSGNELTKILITLQALIRCGADLDENVIMVFNVARIQPESAQTCQRLEYRPFCREEYILHEAETFKNEYGYICSFPAHNILNLLLSEWEPLRRLFNGEEFLADVESSVAYSTGRCSRGNVSVLERLEITGSALPCPGGGNRAEWKWSVAPREHQDQIAKELMSLMTLSDRSVNIFPRESSSATKALGYETLTSMLCGSHWVERGSGSLEDVFIYLEEIGVLARYSISRKLHTMRGRLKRKGVLSAIESGNSGCG